ncbi:hypothetical protein GGR51DRAFT_563719 [Nemania sp. FL0031]|nr:hypothetical protein GGR51DRAFT_563719 [Nemania sp. FL0031]
MEFRMAVFISFLWSSSEKDDGGKVTEEWVLLCLGFLEENLSLNSERVLEDELVDIMETESFSCVDPARSELLWLVMGYLLILGGHVECGDVKEELRIRYKRGAHELYGN